MQSKTVYDIIGIGIGPFNLGLAALAEPIENLNCLFFDQNKEFNWHPGLMLPNARLQVPFYADLVTLADPCSKYSYLSFLKAKQRMFRFAILENNFILRKKYNEYCQWVANQLSCLRFGYRCEAIHYNEVKQLYSVCIKDVANDSTTILQCKNVVVGVGTVPNVPECALTSPGLMSYARNLAVAPSRGGDASVGGNEMIFHSSDYLYFKERLLTKKAVTVVGSGQSAAEIFYDLLFHSSQFTEGLNWVTRSDGFSPMDYSKFTLEKTSPDYIDHFYSLSHSKKKERLASQSHLYKGINISLLHDIYNELFQQHLFNTKLSVQLYSNSTLESINQRTNESFELTFFHSELQEIYCLNSEAVILATGYKYQLPAFMKSLLPSLQLTADGHYQVNRNYSIDSKNSLFVQNAELHSHGFNAPDLGMGPYRNSILLNSILGYERYPMEKQITFQSFGTPSKCPPSR